jgi:hypothetical protein
VNDETRTAVRHYRAMADDCDRAADWYDLVAKGAWRSAGDNGPMPLLLARNVPTDLLTRWARAERARASTYRLTANNLILGRTTT